MDGGLIGAFLGLIVGVAAGVGGLHLYYQSKARTARGLAGEIVDDAAPAGRHPAQGRRPPRQGGGPPPPRGRRRARPRRRARSIRDAERRLEKREDLLDQKLDLINKKEREVESIQRFLGDQQEELNKRNAEAKSVLAEQREALHRLSGLSREDAREQLLRRLEDDLAHEVGGLILRHEQSLKETCVQKAREILASTIQRYAAEHTAETTVSTVDIPSDDMKGRIIGREGRNIRTFEKATGVDVIVDDTPGVVIVVGLRQRPPRDRQAGAREADPGRPDPPDAGSRRSSPRRRRRWRSTSARSAAPRRRRPTCRPCTRSSSTCSAGSSSARATRQNVLQHSIEVAYLTGLLAEELGLDGALGRRCGLLHDIGKAADHEMEGGHPKIGAELTKRYGEGKEVLHAILGHHDDLRPETPYTVLVAAADAISASRPGARRETLEKYVKRLEELEAVACGFPGVEQAYAIQAGREVRVIADSGQLDDAHAAKLCRDIAQAIEEQLTYPGEVKVTVLRETRNVEFAR